MRDFFIYITIVVTAQICSFPQFQNNSMLFFFKLNLQTLED